MRTTAVILVVLLSAAAVFAGVGDAKVGTNHKWNRGDLYYFDFDSLFTEQKRQYEQAIGQKIEEWTPEHLALAAYAWRATHFYHSSPGLMDHGSVGYAVMKQNNGSNIGAECYIPRGYWTGMFAYGHAICGTTHAQWTSLLDRLLGNSRSHVSGVNGHNTLEVFLTGGAYASGRWALLDQDELCVVFNNDPVPRLMSIPELVALSKDERWKILDHTNNVSRQRGWYMFGQKDFGPQGSFKDYDGYDRYSCSLPNSGYEGAPPLLQLRRGEKLRRYYEPGLGGNTYVIWGFNASGKGPSHDRTYATQPERIYQVPPVPVNVGGEYSGFCGNAVYTYTPSFESGDYKEGVVTEDGTQVTFEFNTPYVIGATPPNADKWGCYDEGGRNGLVVTAASAVDAEVAVSVDFGTTWSVPQKLGTSLDLTDLVKGTQAYWIRFGAPAGSLAGMGIAMRTVCQLNGYLVPRIDGVTEVKYKASQQGMKIFGPEKNKLLKVLHAGSYGTNGMVLKLDAPAGAKIRKVYAAAMVASGNPPDRFVSDIDAGKDDTAFNVSLLDSFKVTVGIGDDADDHWSFICIDGEADVTKLDTGTVYLRFANDGGRAYRYALAWITYDLPDQDECKVTFNYGSGQTVSHTFNAGLDEQTWTIDDPGAVKNNWVETECVGKAVDNDHDAMDDAWEQRYFGSLDHNGSGDTDADGACDLHEYLAGTDPVRADSTPPAGQRPGGQGTPHSVTLDASRIVIDGEIDGEEADKDLFTGGYLRLEGHPDASVPNRVLLKFDLGSITDCTTVTKAVLSMGCADGSFKDSNPAQKILVGAAGRDIAAGVHTWNAMKDITALASDVTELAGPGEAGGRDALNATAAVSFWLGRKQPNNGFVVMFADEASRHMKRGWFATDQGGVVHPELAIDYVDGGGMAANHAPVIKEPAAVTMTGTSAAVKAAAEDPDGDALTFAWDFDLADGASFADSNQPSVNIPVGPERPYLAAVKVSDPYGGSDCLVIALAAAADVMPAESPAPAAEPESAAAPAPEHPEAQAAEMPSPAPAKKKGCGTGTGALLLAGFIYGILRKPLFRIPR